MHIEPKDTLYLHNTVTMYIFLLYFMWYVHFFFFFFVFNRTSGWSSLNGGLQTKKHLKSSIIYI